VVWVLVCFLQVRSYLRRLLRIFWGFRVFRCGGKAELIEEFSSLGNSAVAWAYQLELHGFGHAVLMAEPFVGIELSKHFT